VKDRRPSINTILAEVTRYDEKAKYNASIVGIEERQDAMNSKKTVTLYKIAVSKGYVIQPIDRFIVKYPFNNVRQRQRERKGNMNNVGN
jgi:hypothetical protein